MTGDSPPGSSEFLSTLAPTRSQRRLALGVVLVSVSCFLAIAPFAKMPIAQVWAFIPAYQSALVVNDLITATLLFGQFNILRSRALLMLACGYLFTGLIAITHALTFPGLFAPTGLLGAGPQSTAWLYMFWHGGFPLFVIGYALLEDQPSDTRAAAQSTARMLLFGVAAVLLLVYGLTQFATAGQAFLPPIMQGNRYSPAMIAVVSGVWGLSFLALVTLWRRRARSVLDLWLLVVLCAWLFDIALSAVFNGGRFDLGFYAGRAYGLLAASFVLVVLLLENGVLHVRLIEGNRRARAKTLEARELAAELKVLNAKLVDSNDQLQQASQRKSDFLANMSHELRTPLNAIIGFSEVLKDNLVGEISEQQREYVCDILTSGEHLLSLINDILDLSKIEAGRMQLDPEPLAVAELLEGSMSMLREKALSHRVQLALEVEPDLPRFNGDARKIKQIVFNLLSNGVKFTPDGGAVTLRAARIEQAGVPHLEIAVSDTGIGIAEEDQAKLFESFVQIESPASKTYEGTGLGLAMVKLLAGLHGGSVSLQSAPQRGSTFTVRLPWSNIDATSRGLLLEVPRAWRMDRARPLALVVEDEARAAELLRVQLESTGLDVVHAMDAKTGIRLAYEHDPDVITLDILMPGVDGWEFLRALKLERTIADTPVVIISIVGDTIKGLSLGAACVLQKPIDRLELSTALASLGLLAATQRQVTALVVDDDPKGMALLARILESSGYRVLRAQGGREGLELARSAKPDVVLLDLMMPDVSGFEVIDALKVDVATQSIPIIVITAKELSQDEWKALDGHVLRVFPKATMGGEALIREVGRALAGS